MASHRRILDDSIADHLCYYDCNVTGPPPPSLAVVEAPPHHHHHVSTLLFVVAAVFSAVLLLSLIYFAVLRRRRRVGGAFLSAGASSGRSPASDAGETATPAFDEAEEPLHHVWYIRTVGLDEATIDKIAVAEYKSGEGLLAGASGDCSVCLGEFCDGELVRLLPKCGHAFHVPCIDTWLRAHVNCPLCRASIVDPTPLAASPPPATTVVSSPDDVEMGSSVPVDIPTTGIHASEHEQNRTPNSEAAVHVVALANPIELSDAVVESFVPRTQIEHRDDMPQPVRRSASMDSPIFGAVVIRLEPQESFNSAAKEDNYGDIREQYVCRSMEKQGNAQTEIQRSLSSSARGFFYKHSRISKNSSLPS